MCCGGRRPNQLADRLCFLSLPFCLDAVRELSDGGRPTSMELFVAYTQLTRVTGLLCRHRLAQAKKSERHDQSQPTFFADHTGLTRKFWSCAFPVHDQGPSSSH